MPTQRNSHSWFWRSLVCTTTRSRTPGEQPEPSVPTVNPAAPLKADVRAGCGHPAPKPVASSTHSPGPVDPTITLTPGEKLGWIKMAGSPKGGVKTIPEATCVGPAGPSLPVGPSDPVAPVDPAGPSLPVGPSAPVAPVAPA